MTQNRLFGAPMALWIAFFAFSDLMLAFPALDLTVSGWFFEPQAGFVAEGIWWERLLYYSIDVVLIGLILALVFAWWRGRARVKKGLGRRGPSGRQLVLLLALLALVPGLLVNQGLKENLGRARPISLAEFGGTQRFTPAFVPSDEGGGAFSSGHAAAAFFLVVVAVELASARSLWFVLALAYVVAIGLSRIASGGHFLSDVMTSAFLVWIGYLMLLAIWPPAAANSIASPHKE
ncbi:phosphatase PAP2 family protein [Thiorhodovibrio frisius]|uniref:undecaprenyl-diphosphate phosphatase n=1 Tax=Thiorhodovibrio frisius TaxID=631362 RepID=H8Z4M5_9GAMM|nr:phosphatase PAP2 family protein [Thiorhodovibrio frisius]EIC20282.1 PAP2 (acid phosphatase) superfamily protein [Thiorhodovibrio frisius]WPL21019.1 PAP2 (acid phosphatase) superfamily protein [Thiorhodovibrio frisius]